jgi:hypothetical protein
MCPAADCFDAFPEVNKKLSVETILENRKALRLRRKVGLS